MRAANPNLKVLMYENGALVKTATQYPSAWYAHSSSGALVRSRAPGVFNAGNYLMDMGNPDWLNASATRCATDRATSGYDGCYYGMLSLSALAPGYLDSQPIDTSTGLPWTEQAWVVAMEHAVTAIRDANPGVIITANTLQAGGTYFNTDGTSVRPILDLEDAGQAEDFLRGGTARVTNFQSEDQWVDTVSMLVDAGARGDRILAQTKIWTTATAAQIDAWHRYTVATFLMGTNGLSYLNFSTDHTMAALTADSSYDRVNIGSPIDTFAKVGGVYRRDFTNGIALVNPTTSVVSVPLLGCVTDLGGLIHTLSITLQPNQGDVLLQNC
jgi:hypothetical protein